MQLLLALFTVFLADTATADAAARSSDRLEFLQVLKKHELAARDGFNIAFVRKLERQI